MLGLATRRLMKLCIGVVFRVSHLAVRKALGPPLTGQVGGVGCLSKLFRNCQSIPARRVERGMGCWVVCKNRACLSSQNVMQPRNRTLASNIPLCIVRYLKLSSLQDRAKHGNSPQGCMHVGAISFGFSFSPGSFLNFSLIRPCGCLRQPASLLARVESRP